MRFLLACAGLAIAAAPAAAEPRPQPRVEVALGFVAQSARLRGLPNRNLGANAELAIGRGRSQLFLEGSALAVTLGGDLTGGHAGWLGRAGGGVRWIARALELDRLSAELGFEAFAAVQRIWFGDGARLTRPELGGGFAWQARLLPHELAFRTSVRVLVTPSGAAGDAVCRGSCVGGNESGAPGPSTGAMIVVGVAW